MLKITFPDITKDRAVEIVESIYGVMYWNYEEGKQSAYPLGANNPVVIASQPGDSVDAIKPCLNCGSTEEANWKHCAKCWEEK